MLEPFLSAVPVLEKIEKAGFEAYFVGGAVRDFLLNKSISDVDIATSATPNEVKRIFPKTVDIGIEHGTVLVIYQNESYEITTFRTESEYQDFRRPNEVTFVRSLYEDLQRRDFTMNAIAMDRNGKLIDPFNGQSAIQERKIQTVGQATERFREDALRMMRAVRFVSQLGFDLEGETVKALAILVPLLDKIAIERKRSEFEKLLKGKNRKQALNLLIKTGLFSFLPGLKNQKNPLEDMQVYDFDELKKNEMWALLLYALTLKEKAVEDFLRNWRLPVKEIRDIQQIFLYLLKRLNQEWTLYDLYVAGHDTIKSVEIMFQVIKGTKKNEAITRWLKLYEQLPIKERSEMNVTGNDLMTWFDRKGGPWLKEQLVKIEKSILEEKVVNDNSKIKEWLMECNQK
ncbi:CCA tRNA nucleotidyltransferase [Neobacillus ginsengisoli]|uniref:CCA-adding enzyme n=1 Tax=Neobacillus ginsengisoli TaxID=904295 RepID=A0ABT9XQ50_9BACI|nr:CCA tRNA nucleotidyltransferase [Neobacillus ginsengisoli]MDQ0197533.1 tRNA nucleotidyltransferase (CCA-adding enzyme) [Neobacillus ginsengisoli]